MHRQCSIILAALVATALAVPPLSKDDAGLGHNRLEKLMSFIDGQVMWTLNELFSSCKVNSRIFNDTCANVNPFTDCSTWRCTNPQYTNQSSCQANQAFWEEFDKKSRCCAGRGNKECKYNDDGTEEIRCCEVCFDPARILAEGQSTQTDIDEYCSLPGYRGPSVCGATAGTCGYCVEDPDTDDQGTCTGSGTCSNSEGRLWQYTEQNSCSQNNGTWTSNHWAVKTSAVTEDACYADAYCGLCFNQSSTSRITSESDCRRSGGKCSCEGQNGCPGDKDSCGQQGHTWYAATWQKDSSVTSEPECRLKGDKYEWKKNAKFETGAVIPAPPLPAHQDGCSTGASHVVDGRVDGLSGDLACANDTQLLEDAAAELTAQEAIDANPFFYKKQLHKMIGPDGFLRATVTNNVTNIVDRAKIVLAKTACFAPLVEPRNKGTVLVEGGPKTNVLIVRPTNYVDADAINVLGGAARVLGGTNAGAINVATTGKIELFGVINSGPVQCSISQDILIANITNLAGGSVVVTDVSATLFNIYNEGSVVVKGPAQGATAQGGHYAAYDIVNKGSVDVQAGTIDIATICPSSGTISISAGVTGTVTYESGCKGTITAPSTVTVSAIDKLQTVISGTMGMTVPDADAFLTDAIAQNAVRDGIAETAGVSSSHVVLDVAKVRRLNDNSPRRLAGTSVSIAYTITVPQMVSSSTATQAVSKMASVTVAQLSKRVVARVAAAKGSNFAVSVTSKGVPSVAKMTTTTTTMRPSTSSTTTAANDSSSSNSTTTAGSMTSGNGYLPSSGVVPLPACSIMALFLSRWVWVNP